MRSFSIGSSRLATHLDGAIEALEPPFQFGRALAESGDTLAAGFGVFLSAVEHGGKDSFQPCEIHTIDSTLQPVITWGSDGGFLSYVSRSARCYLHPTPLFRFRQTAEAGL